MLPAVHLTALRLYWPDVIAVAAVAAWMGAVSSSADNATLATAIGLVAAGTLLLRRRWPIATLVIVLAALVTAEAAAGFDGPDDPYLVLILAGAYSIGRHAPLRHQPWAAAITLAFAALNTTEKDVTWPGDVVFPVLFIALPWGAGLALQLAAQRTAASESRTASLTEEIDKVADRAGAEERLRIARELHDVMGHSLTGMSLQLQTMRRQAEAGQAPPVDALRSAEELSHELLVDVRRLVGLLDTGDDADRSPPPDLTNLGGLISRSRRQDQRVTLHVEGTARTLPPALSAACYRIVQEALSNAQRHGGAGPVNVTVRWVPGAVTLETCNPTDADAVLGSGHGLAGMRERALMHGGRVDVRHGAGTWTVTAALPTPMVEDPT